MSKRPNWIAYTITRSSDGRGFWNRVGAGWDNQDGSINLRLFALPCNGEIQLRAPTERDQVPDTDPNNGEETAGDGDIPF